MAKKKNSGYLKNFERNSGIGRNDKKNLKKIYTAKKFRRTSGHSN
jgi:hypothetical protein